MDRHKVKAQSLRIETSPRRICCVCYKEETVSARPLPDANRSRTFDDSEAGVTGAGGLAARRTHSYPFATFG
jgi:hypothetical protein